MRVLYFHQHFSTREGSGGTRSFEMARSLARRGHEVTVVCGSTRHTGLSADFKGGKRSGMVSGFRVIEFHVPYSNHLNFARRILAFIKFALQSLRIALTEPCDLVFASSTPLTIAIPGIAAKLFRRKPFVFEVRDLWPELPRAMGVIKNPIMLWLMDVLEWTAYRAADGVIGLSPGICSGVIKRGVAQDRAVLVPNGCDLDLFKPTDAGPVDIQGVEPSDFVAAFCGAHGLANGLDAVLDAAKELRRRRRIDIKLLFIGEGGQKARLIDRARAENLTNCIFVDSLPKRALAELLPKLGAGLMVLANVPAFYYGTSPNKFFDYIASGIPVINNYPGWLAELISDNRCGLVVPPNDASAFADALIALADASDMRRQLGENGRALAEREFDRTRLAVSFCTFLDKMGRAAKTNQEQAAAANQ